MGLKLGQVSPTPGNGSAVVYTSAGKQDAAKGMDVFENDLLQTSAGTASIQIIDPTVPATYQVAAIVSGTYSNVNVYYPPATVTRVYYNNSYRYKLRSPGGYVGIRG